MDWREGAGFLPSILCGLSVAARGFAERTMAKLPDSLFPWETNFVEIFW
jgi:hypothetical protein